MEHDTCYSQPYVLATLRNVYKRLSSEAASWSHDHPDRNVRKQRTPQPGDLVVVQNHAVDNQRGRYLEAKWFGPLPLTRVTAHGLRGCVRGLPVSSSYSLILELG